MANESAKKVCFASTFYLFPGCQNILAIQLSSSLLATAQLYIPLNDIPKSSEIGFACWFTPSLNNPDQEPKKDIDT